MGQSNIESFRPAVGDPDAVAVKTAAIAAAVLRPTPDGLPERWAIILWPTGGAVVSGVYRFGTRPRALSGGRSSREDAERS